MKNLILICSIGLVLSFGLGIDVPEAVKKAFGEKFPSATNVKWEMENNAEYEAEFKMNGTEMSANFKSDGTLLETETEIEIATLPSAVADAVKNKYPDAKIEEAEKVESSAKGIVYELEIQQGKNESEVIVSADGTSIELENEVGDDKDEDDDD